ncbi:Spy/CpxP family protein refolding chaperone [Bradyrhizobium sp. 186]|uniref:Spy/CpxP family protein refolding chaperone n=1 Tax=Bradyrhizobium sp. 186 TaxID=2782654 RepID=UPI00200193D4|nr:Spy/CpxP family protein refolding chaperone [Bradyrhizobium sp. 186]UPK35329.1 Spy/CpxP family protein refolding chaperone [Bradyrhizobium sp. 186]
MKPILLPILALGFSMLMSLPGAAQDCKCDPSRGHAQVSAAPAASPYAGMERRDVKALSEQQINHLRAGRGMGLSLPAELNGHPGPAHVLELADALRLSGDQRAKAKEFLEAMKAETISVGEQIIAEETALDRLFAEKHATRAGVDAAAFRIASAQGELRAAHLHYHLAMSELLTPEQIMQYVALRGYGNGGHHQHQQH